MPQEFENRPMEAPQEAISAESILVALNKQHPNAGSKLHDIEWFLENRGLPQELKTAEQIAEHYYSTVLASGVGSAF